MARRGDRWESETRPAESLTGQILTDCADGRGLVAVGAHLGPGRGTAAQQMPGVGIGEDALDRGYEGDRG